jgi:two-component system sensor histidine kinase PhoQ
VTLSITRRLLVGHVLVLAAFLGLAGIALDRAFRSNVESAAREELQAHVYTLLTAAEPDSVGRMRLPAQLAAPDFNQPDSGLYAEIAGSDDGYRWRSGSLIGWDRQVLATVAPGTRQVRRDAGLLLLDQGVLWEDDSGQALLYTLTVGRDSRPLDRQQAAFRATLWQWLGGVSTILLLVLLGLLRWGLRPLHAMSDAVEQLERGERVQIDGPVPRELQGLSDNLNGLIRLSADRQARVRNSLSDLAHSLKTPLAVLRTAADQEPASGLAALVDEQVGRIDQIVSYQRQRAAVAGATTVIRPIALRPLLDRLCNSLAKVHREKGVAFSITLAEGDTVKADEGDLFELFGNLLENAFRHAARQLEVHGRRGNGRLVIDIDDDGPGIAPDDSERLLQRGERADQRYPGEGIGLAVVNEIAHQYGGPVEILRAPLGGARIRVSLPG